jgi:hypothetical protein
MNNTYDLYTPTQIHVLNTNPLSREPFEPLLRATLWSLRMARCSKLIPKSLVYSHDSSKINCVSEMREIHER